MQTKNSKPSTKKRTVKINKKELIEMKIHIFVAYICGVWKVIMKKALNSDGQINSAQWGGNKYEISLDKIDWTSKEAARKRQNWNKSNKRNGHVYCIVFLMVCAMDWVHKRLSYVYTLISNNVHCDSFDLFRSIWNYERIDLYYCFILFRVSLFSSHLLFRI